MHYTALMVAACVAGCALVIAACGDRCVISSGRREGVLRSAMRASARDRRRRGHISC